MRNRFKEIKVCPYCGMHPIIKQEYCYGQLYITCSNKKCVLKPNTFDFSHMSLKRQIDIWNQRPKEDKK